jgi:trehalose synthase
MLRRVRTATLPLSAFREHAEPAQLRRIETLARSLRGLRVIHVNATPDGGGVAEILRSLVPLSRSLGLDARWYVLPPDDAFFDVTKRMHNWLQGAPGRLLSRDKRTYLAHLLRVAEQTDTLRADVWVIHDPQPLPLRALVPLEGPAIWRCHIDCSTPNGSVAPYLQPWIRSYDLTLYSMPQYALPGLLPGQMRVIQPAIDPLSAKNRPLAADAARAILDRLGIDPRRPLVTQVSRFDPWKDPWQVIDAYRLARRELPGLQLALVGVFSAKDDPEAPRVYRSVRRYAAGDPDIHLFTDAVRVGQQEVNAFQSGSTVILQRSLREGFGLTVTEAMWKGRPVIGRPVGGVTTQIRDGKDGFLAETAGECAARIVQLVADPRLARAIGEQARRSVRRRFLLPRLLLDELQLYAALSAGRSNTTQVA